MKKMDKTECQNHRMVHLEHQIGWTNFSLTQNKSCVVLPWPCCKIGHGQPTVIIWTNYDGVESPMLHTKPPGHWYFGCREEGFWNFYHILAWRPSYSCDPDPTNFCSHIPLMLQWNLALIGDEVLEKNIFENNAQWQRGNKKTTLFLASNCSSEKEN